MSDIPPGTPWNNGYIESFNNRLRKECLNRNHWNTLFEARVVIGDFKHEHNHRHRHSALGYLTPAEYAARSRGTSTIQWSARSISLTRAGQHACSDETPTPVTTWVAAAHRGITVSSGADRVGLAAKRSTMSASPAKPGAADMSVATRRLAWR